MALNDDLPISPDDSPRTDVRPGFERQRRQLLATSVVLGLFLASGLRLDELNILGNKFLVQRPELIPLGLGTVWAYFVLRYLQYLNDLADDGSTRAYIARLRRVAWSRVRREFEAKYPGAYWPEGRITDVRFRYDGISSWGEPYGPWHVVFHATLHFKKPDGEDGAHGTEEQRHQIFLSPLERSRARAWVLLRTRYFTEYSLPLIVAAVPLVLLIPRLIAFVRAG